MHFAIRVEQTSSRAGFSPLFGLFGGAILALASATPLPAQVLSPASSQPQPI
jgi:hypothetical protein